MGACKELGKWILSALCFRPKAKREQARNFLRKAEAFLKRSQAARAAGLFWAWRKHVAITQYQLCVKREQDRRMLQAWRHYTRQRRLKRALFPPTLFNPPARKHTANIPCGTPLTPAGNKIGVAWPQMPDSFQSEISANPRIEGSGTPAGKQAVALGVICT